MDLRPAPTSPLPADATAEAPPSAVTVVMMTRNRRDQTLHSLERLTSLRPAPPVVVVDNASADGTADAVKKAWPAVRVVALRTNLGACGRNEGVALATTPWVAFSDDDSWWAPGALEAGADVLSRYPSVGLVMGRILVGPQEYLDPACAAMARAPLGMAPVTPFPRTAGFVACGSIVRRDAYEQVGGFHEVVRFPGEEETVALDLVTAGWELVYVEEVVAHHHPQESVQRSTRSSDLARSHVLTCWLRQPLGVALWSTARLAGRAVRSRADLRALGEVLMRLPAALRRRRVSPLWVRRRFAAAG